MMPDLRAGSAAVIKATVTDMLADPPVLLTPDGGVRVTLHSPTGTTPVNSAVMTNTATGKYVYVYQSATTDPLGLWTYEFKTQHGTNIVLEPIAGAFMLKSALGQTF